MGAGVLASLLLPRVPGGFELPFGSAAAYAAGDTCTVKVVSKSQVGFAAVDVTNGTRTALPGVNVTVTSRYGAKLSVSGTTDDTGVALLDIAALSEGADKTTGELDAYAFNGSIKATKDGYRIFETGIARIEGGNGLAVPMRLLQQGVPYASRFTFDEWDIQYTQSTFTTTSGNTQEHELWISLEGMGDGVAMVYLMVENVDTPAARISVNCLGGSGEGKLTGQLLLLGGAAALPVAGSFSCTIEQDGKVYSFPLSLAVAKGAVEEDTNNEKEPLDLAQYDDMSEGGINIKIPGNIPVLSGSGIRIELPQIPFIYNLSPHGYAMMGYSTMAFGCKSDNGEVTKTSWSTPRETFGDQWKKQWQDYDEAISAWRGVRDNGANSMFKQVKLIPGYSLSFDMRFLAHARIDWSTMDWVGAASGMVRLLGSATLSEQFIVGPVPLFVELSFDAMLAAALNLGIRRTSGENAKITWDYGNDGFTLNLVLEAALSVGAGIHGVLSASVRGSVSASIFLGFTAVPVEGAPRPHLIVGAAAKAEVVVQVFLVKWSKDIADCDWPKLYDNWSEYTGKVTNGDEGSDLTGIVASPFSFGTGSNGLPIWSETGAAASGTPSNGAGEPLIPESAVLVTMDELALSAEVGATASPTKNESPLVVSWQPTSKGADSVSYALDDTLSSEGFSFGSLKAQENEAVGSTGVKDVDDTGGIIPTVDQRIAGESFSDPRAHVVTLGAKTYLFRIISVNYQGVGARSRLAVQTLESGAWGSPEVLDYDTGLSAVSRIDLFDYDFDLAVLGNEICVALVGSVRTNEKGVEFTTVTEVCTTPVITYLRLGADLAVRQRRAWLSSTGASYESGYHAYLCPRITAATSATSVSAAASARLLISYLHRTASVAADVMTTAATVTFEAISVSPTSISFSTATKSLTLDPSTHDMIVRLSDETNPDKVMFEIVTVSTNEMGLYNAFVEPSGAGVTKRYNFPYQVGCACLWPGKTEFLFTYDGDLYAGSFGTSRLNMRKLSPENSRFDSFVVSDSGNYLFFGDSRVGKTGQTYDAALNRQDKTGTRYRIMAARYVPATSSDTEAFTHPFPFAVVPHPTDALCCFARGESASAFVCTSITDMSKSRADLYFVDVPKVSCSTVTDFACVDPTVCAGKNASFDVTVRNDGNQRLAGFTFYLYDGDVDDSPAVASTSITYDDKNVLPSGWDYRHGVPTNDGNPASDGSFEPGETCVCRVVFVIPSSWKGTKKVRVGAASAIIIPSIKLGSYGAVAGGGAAKNGAIRFADLTAQATDPDDDTDDDPELLESIIEHLMMYDDCPVDSLEIDSEVTVSTVDLDDAPVTLASDATGSSGDQQPAKTSGGLTPSTGDDVALALAPAALAAGALAAGFVAYSKRRESLEHDDGDGGE